MISVKIVFVDFFCGGARTNVQRQRPQGARGKVSVIDFYWAYYTN